jgi:ATP-binding cassette subfamily C protein
MSAGVDANPTDWTKDLSGDRLRLVRSIPAEIPAFSILVVTVGRLTLFGQRMTDGKLQGSSVQLAFAEPGDLIFMPRDGKTIRFWARPASDTEMIPIALDDVGDTGCLAEISQGLDRFTSELVSEDLRFWMRASSDSDNVIVSGRDVSGSSRSIAFVSATKALVDALGASSQASGRPGGLEALGAAYSACIEEAATDRINQDDLQFLNRVKSSQALNSNTLNQSIRGITSSMRLTDSNLFDKPGSDPFDSACRLVALQMGIQVEVETGTDHASRISQIESFCQTAHLRHREILLDSEWWNQNGGHLVARHEATSDPVALIRTHSGYRAHVFEENGEVKVVKVDRRFAQELDPHAQMFYPSLPPESIGFREIVSLALRGSRGDFLLMFIATLVLAVFNATTPVILSWIVGWVIPLVQVNAIFYFGSLLLLAAVGSALVHVVSGYAFLRIETRSSFYVLAAFVDRVLRLPADFFRVQSSGDLSQRIMAIEQIRSRITQSIVSVVVSFMSGFAYIILMFYYDFQLGLVGLGLVLVLLIALSVFGLLLARAEFALAVSKGALDGVSLDIFTGIRQIRIQGSFSRVLARLVEHLGSVGQASYVTAIYSLIIIVITAGMPVVAIIVLFAYYGRSLISDGSVALESAHFIAFLSAMTAFFGSATLLGSAIPTIAGVFPLFRRLRPIMDSPLEVESTQKFPGKIDGTIEIRDLVFRYSEDLPPILDGINIKIKKGQFVALVGQTGCGKSTLIKLLLGLEKPESGQILFDGTPLENVDPSGIRSQIGVVMQSLRLMPGNIKSTILGLGSTLPLEAAWEAAKLADIDQEIDNMPMGMLTSLSADSTLSGGQKQRLLIARALVGNPSILFMDEATSALDNNAQASITHTINNLGVTRVVIAHRLSTIRDADQIHVLESGRIIQSGTFDELCAQEGHFAELMKRQMT